VKTGGKTKKRAADLNSVREGCRPDGAGAVNPDRLMVVPPVRLRGKKGGIERTWEEKHFAFKERVQEFARKDDIRHAKCVSKENNHLPDIAT